MPPAPAVAASTAATASSSSTHNEGRKKGLFANAMIDLHSSHLPANVTIGLQGKNDVIVLPGGL
jgi:hypothetical protein